MASKLSFLFLLVFFVFTSHVVVSGNEAWFCYGECMAKKSVISFEANGIEWKGVLGVKEIIFLSSLRLLISLVTTLMGITCQWLSWLHNLNKLGVMWTNSKINVTDCWKQLPLTENRDEHAVNHADALHTSKRHRPNNVGAKTGGYRDRCPLRVHIRFCDTINVNTCYFFFSFLSFT